jgi:hypothetical protein
LEAWGRYLMAKAMLVDRLAESAPAGDSSSAAMLRLLRAAASEELDNAVRAYAKVKRAEA